MLRNKTVTGVLWKFAEQLSRKGIGIAITLLLARFLVPADYGLVAMMAVFIALANTIMESGLTQALIRKKNASQVDYNTAFYCNLALGAVSYFLLFLSAPFVAAFYNEPSLEILIRVAGSAVLINSFQIVQVAILSRELNFRAQLMATVPAGIISGVMAILLAYYGWGVWALIGQMILAAFFTTLLLWRYNLWRPSLNFSLYSLKEMLGFGVYLFLEGIFSTIFRNLYVVVIAKFFSANIAGYYFFATKIKELIISQLVGSIQNVTYPALASIQDDKILLKSGYRKVIGVTTFLLFPAMTMMAALSGPLFNAFLPDKWMPAVPYLQLICIAGLMYPLHSINLNILNVVGRSDLVLYIGFFKKFMSICILLISFRFGIFGILIGQIIGSVLSYIPNSYFSSRLINYPIREQVADFMPGLVLSGVVGMVVYGAGFMIHWPAIVELAVLASLAGFFYLAGAHLMKLQAYVLARQMVMERLGRA